MAIISVSLNDQNLEDLSRIEDEMGFSGRSEVIRAGIRELVAEHRDLERMEGVVDATLLVVHDDEHSSAISEIRHAHQDIIKTQIHNHLKNHKCLEVFVLSGAAENVRHLINDFQGSKKVELVKLVVS